ncbi:unnamed protein product [Caenorhabditis brenneri]
MCLVCGSLEAEPHFGGISCRACAAFFRRYYRSGRILNMCTCKRRELTSHPCRKCRMDKCLKVGMSPEKVQVCRDKHCARAPKPSTSTQILPSLLTARILPKDISNISFAIPNFQQFQQNRIELTGGKMAEMNIFELTSTTKMDLDLVWRMVNNMFPMTREMMEKDRAALVRNFIPKFWMLSPVLDCIENPDFFDNMEKEEYENMVVAFYDGSFIKGKELSKKEILRVFEPFWYSFYTKIAPPIVGLNLKQEELMGIMWLLFFDNGYTNISTECQEICRTMRKMIYLELKNFQNSRKFDEMRFFDTVEVLEIIERSEMKLMEEILICEMHNVRIHDDFKTILRENKF